ncbi:MAG: hypothetical protein JO180_11160 [Gemmatirosa sp.]|nr:hypothetical protein [Gemmatirosa sp.]
MNASAAIPDSGARDVELELCEARKESIGREPGTVERIPLVSTGVVVESDEQVFHVHRVGAALAAQRVGDAEGLAGGDAE